MKTTLLTTIIFSIVFLWSPNTSFSQNKNFIFSIALGAGNSGFNIKDQGVDEIKGIYYPMGGLQIQNRINSKWALNFFPNLGLSGSRRIFLNPIGNITEAKSISHLLNLAIHPKYFLNKSFYVSLGPEISYLFKNFGHTYNQDERLLSIDETKFYNKTNLLISSSIGFSLKSGESRKNAPIKIDVLWFCEIRAKRSLTNILKSELFEGEPKLSFSSLELVTGISFASKN